MAYDSPDPTCAQFGAFQKAVAALRDGCEIGLSPLMKVMQKTHKNKVMDDGDASWDQDIRAALENSLVWYDYSWRNKRYHQAINYRVSKLFWVPQ